MATKESQEDPLLCSVCGEDKEAYWRCLKCREELCDDCTKIHRKAKVYRNHTLSKIKEPVVTTKCDVHKAEYVHMYCLTCCSPVCPKCISSKKNHQHHILESIDKQVENLRKEFIERLTTIKEKNNRTLQDDMTKYEVFAGRDKEKILSEIVKQRLDIFHDAIERKASAIKTDRENKYEEHQKKLGVHQQKLKEKIDCRTRELDEMLKKLSSQSDIELITKRDDILTEITKFDEWDCPQVPEFTLNEHSNEIDLDLLQEIQSLVNCHTSNLRGQTTANKSNMQMEDDINQLKIERNFYEDAYKETIKTLNQLVANFQLDSNHTTEVNLKLPNVPEINDREKEKQLKKSRKTAGDDVRRLSNLVKDFFNNESQKTDDTAEKRNNCELERLTDECKRVNGKHQKEQAKLEQETSNLSKTEEKYEQIRKKAKCICSWIDTLYQRVMGDTIKVTEFGIPPEIKNRKALEEKQKQIQKIDDSLLYLIKLENKDDHPTKKKGSRPKSSDTDERAINEYERKIKFLENQLSEKSCELTWTMNEKDKAVEEKEKTLTRKIEKLEKEKEMLNGKIADLRQRNRIKMQVLKAIENWVESLNGACKQVTDQENTLDLPNDVNLIGNSDEFFMNIKTKFVHIHQSFQQLNKRLTEECKRVNGKLQKEQAKLEQETINLSKTEEKYEQIRKKAKCICSWIDILYQRVIGDTIKVTEFGIPPEIKNRKALEEKQKQIQKIDDSLLYLKKLENKDDHPTKKKGSRPKSSDTDERAINEYERKIKFLENQLTEKSCELTWTMNEKDKAVEEKEKTLTRLSEIAGSRLRDSNPAIADLSDENRPTKLAEKFSEMYDNEWTDAFHFETTALKLPDKDAIERLLDIFQGIYNQCLQMAWRQLNYFICPYTEDLSSAEIKPSDVPHIPKETLGKVKDLQRLLVPDILDAIEKKITTMGRFVDDFKEEVVNCRGYISHCVRICWIMNVQDPPVVLMFENEKNKPIDTKLYKHYTKSGKRIDYMVWPAMLLYKDGPLLQKGVVQPI